MTEGQCEACGLQFRVTVTGPEFSDLDFIERCETLKLRVEERWQPNKPFSQQKAECPHLNASIARAG